ncbi:MAG: TRAP transporter large permease subunit [Chloroflexota bacterium]
MIALFLLVIGGIYFGIFTPVEAGAIGVLGAILISFVGRTFSIKMLVNSLSSTGQTVITIMMILLGAMVFNTFIALSKLPYWLSNTITDSGLPPYGVLIAIILLYIPMGMFLDTLAMVILTAPIFFPMALALGFDIFWFAVIVVIMIEAAQISPPVGMTCFVVAGLTKTPLSVVFKGIIPYVLVQFLAVVIIVLVPQIATFLPHLMMG